MPKIILKEELHNSREDLKEEKKLRERQDFEVLIQEGKENSIACKEGNPWYALPFCIFFIFYSPLLLSYESLTGKARNRGIKTRKTRKNDLVIYEEATSLKRKKSWSESAFIAVLFFILSSFGLPVFLTFPLTIWVFLGLFPGILRRLNMERRNKKIADKITQEYETAEKGVLAIVGKEHASGIKENLSKNGLNTKIKPADHGTCSLMFIKDFFIVPLGKLKSWIFAQAK